MESILQSGLSVRIAWYISGGMHSRDNYRNAEERVRELFDLPQECIQTYEDAEAVHLRFMRSAHYLQDEVCRLHNYLLQTQSVYLQWCKEQEPALSAYQVAAE